VLGRVFHRLQDLVPGLAVAPAQEVDVVAHGAIVGTPLAWPQST
jgi:hypothetical protein